MTEGLGCTLNRHGLEGDAQGVANIVRSTLEGGHFGPLPGDHSAVGGREKARPKANEAVGGRLVLA